MASLVPWQEQTNPIPPAPLSTPPPRRPDNGTSWAKSYKVCGCYKVASMNCRCISSDPMVFGILRADWCEEISGF